MKTDRTLVGETCARDIASRRRRSLALGTGHILGLIVFQVLPLILSQGGRANAAAFRIARLLGQHVGEEQLRRRARLIQDLLRTAGPLAGVVVTAIGSVYAGLKGVIGS